MVEEELRVLLATDRAAIRALFDGIAQSDSARVTIEGIDPAVPEVVFWDATPEVAVIDAGIEDTDAQSLAHRLHQQRPSLPIVALVCCHHAAQPRQLSGLAAAGVSGLIDLHAGPDETLTALQGAARGDVIVRLRLSESYKRLWRTMVATEGRSTGDETLSEAELGLLDLVARGLNDREMGRRLNLSPHTVKHRIEQLREKLEIPNRIALAAWAGKHLNSPRAAAGERRNDMELAR